MAVVHVSLPAERWAPIDIVNLFEADGGDVLTFEETGMHVKQCLVNGERTDFAAYVRDRGLADGRRPRVGDFAGPMTFGEIGYQLLNQTFVTLRAL